MWCTSCGADLGDTDRFCGKCGTRSGNRTKASECNLDAEASVDEKLQLSPAAIKSLAELRKKFESNNEGKKSLKQPKKSNICSISNLAVGIQILDNELKPVRKLFPSCSGSVGILQISVKMNSTEKDWLQILSRMFKNITFTTRIPTEDGYVQPETELTTQDLLLYKKKKKLSEARLFVVAEGKGKKEIKQAYQDKSKVHVIDSSFFHCYRVPTVRGNTYFQETVSSDDDLPSIFRPKKKRLCYQQEKSITATDSKSVCGPYTIGQDKEHVSKNQLAAVEIPSDQHYNKNMLTAADTPSVQHDTVAAVVEPPVNEHKMKEAQSDHCLEIDDDCIVVNPPVPVCTATVPEQAVIKQSTSIDSVSVVSSVEELEEDEEMKNFLLHQSRLAERKNQATQRIAKRWKKCNGKQFVVIYSAHGYRTFCIKADPEAEIDLLYDYICSAEESLPPRFHLESKEGDIFSTSFHGLLRDIPSTLYIVEKDFEHNDTLTNYGEVFFSTD